MVFIRPAIETDLPTITTIYNEAVLKTTATFDTEPKSLEAQRRWYAAHGPRHPILVAEVDGAVVGWSCLSPWKERPAYADTAETSFYVSEAFRGRGIGRRLKESIIDEARLLGFHSLIAGVAQGSDASRHLNLEFGFTPIGVFKEVGYKFGRRLDVEYLQKILE